MRHLEKITEYSLEELTAIFDERYKNKITSEKGSSTYKSKANIQLNGNRNMQSLSSGFKTLLPSSIHIKSFKDYVILEVTLSIAKLLIPAFVFALAITLALITQTPLSFALIVGAVVGLITFVFLYYRVDQGIKEYTKNLVKK